MSEWDWAVHPGELLYEILEARDMSQTELAGRTGLSVKHINQICRGHIGITADVAIALERALGVNASLWVNLDAAYRLMQARRRANEAARST